jgi:hypothetical protein
MRWMPHLPVRQVDLLHERRRSLLTSAPQVRKTTASGHPGGGRPVKRAGACDQGRRWHWWTPSDPKCRLIKSLP